MKKRLFAFLMTMLLAAALGGCGSTSANDLAVGEIQSLNPGQVEEAVWYETGETTTEEPLTEEELSSVVDYLSSIKGSAANTTQSTVVDVHGIRLNMKDGTQWQLTPGSSGSKVNVWFSEQDYTVTIKCKDLAELLGQHTGA